METNDLKPDFERIIQIMNLPESIAKKYLSERWEGIIKGRIPYAEKDIQELKALLEEFNLESCYNDFLFLANENQRLNKGITELKETASKFHGKQDELLYALKFLFNNDTENIILDLKEKIHINKTSISNQILIQVIKKALLEYFIETDIYIEQGFSKIEEIEDWGRYFDFILLEKECYSVKKGRRSKHSLAGKTIDYLQKYLQEYSEIKAEKGTSISRRQASFIYKFLNIFEIIPDKLAWEEDNIRHILTKYREKQSKKNPAPNIEKAIKEYSEYSEGMKAKIKKINKNKLP